MFLTNWVPGWDFLLPSYFLRSWVAAFVSLGLPSWPRCVKLLLSSPPLLSEDESFDLSVLSLRLGTTTFALISASLGKMNILFLDG